MAIKLKIGPPVIGEDFFGRWNELKKAEDWSPEFHNPAQYVGYD